MDAREILAYFKAREGAIVDLIRKIVDIESPSFNEEQSRKAAAWIEQQVLEIDSSAIVETVAADGVGTHVIVRAFQGDAKPNLLLGHTDTVHPVGTFERNGTRIEDGKLFGCGVFDMKAGIVVGLEALRFFVANGIRPPRPINILLSCDEEVGSFTGRPLVEREAANAEACLVLEPSAQGRVKTGRKGTGMFKLTAHGRQAHAGLEPEKGVNAVAELSRQVDSIHSIARPEVGTTVNVTTFHGGTVLNVIPELAVCDIDVRYEQAAEATRIEDELNSLSAIDTECRLELTGSINRPPLERNAGVLALYEKARSLATTFDYEIGEAQVGGGSDGNFVAALGVPVLDGLGVTGDGAHTLDEYILVDDIAKRATLLTLLLSTL
jgi:glutamate carboxypeptidase